GVTHNTLCLQDQKTVFSNPEDWNQMKDRVTTNKKCSDKYFTNCTAYGSWPVHGIDDINTYWKAASEPSLNHWLTQSTPIPFLNLYNVILGGKLPDGTQAFPHIGKLIGSLVVADYASVGKVVVLTVEEMGCIIFTNNAGALKGLE
ncbi:hypothetical protein BYT27DRAFT_7079507, partial [Phlegmacium glaucopus]